MLDFVKDTGSWPAEGLEESEELSGPLAACWQELLHPLLRTLDEHMDRRLVRTLERTVLSIMRHRHRQGGLLLSELGAFLCGEAHAPAGTKRLSNLLRSSAWKAQEISDYLWQRSEAEWREMARAEEEALLLWDESVLEKPESLHSEGLSPVRSSKAKRLSRIKPGFFRPPGAPVFVPGLNWLALLLIGRSGPPRIAAMRWWGTRKPPEPTTSAAPTWLSTRREIAQQLLARCAQTFGLGVIHIFDRGYSGGPWLELLHHYLVRFIVRWTKEYPLEDLQGHKKAAWKLLRGKRSWGKRRIKDSPRGREYEVGIVAVPVRHPNYGNGLHPLWLVASRPGKGREPWYLLTNEPITSEADAWEVVLAYARRWQIEGCFRFNKCELAMESPRLWTWEGREKLLLIVTLVYCLLLLLLRLPLSWRQMLLRQWCHRTGKRSRETQTPLYRLRAALAALCNSAQPDLFLYQNSG